MIERQVQLFHDTQHSERENVTRRKLIKIPLDVLLLVVIVNIFICIFTFSLGVERGRRIVAAAKGPRHDGSSLEDTSLKPVQAPEKTAAAGVKETAKEKKERKEKRYLVQVASYQKHTAASKEEATLQRQGFPTLLKRKGKYIVVYVGEYTSRKKAEEAQLLLRKRYSDCFIKRRIRRL